SAPLARVEVSTPTCSRLGLVPSATDLWEGSGMTFLTDRRPLDVPLRAWALPAHRGLGGRLRRGGEAPSESRQPGAQATPPRPVGLAVPRPVDQERLAADLLALDEAPVAAVLRVVAVVAHDEVGAWWHHRRLAAVEIAAVGRRHGGNGAGTD